MENFFINYESSEKGTYPLLECRRCTNVFKPEMDAAGNLIYNPSKVRCALCGLEEDGGADKTFYINSIDNPVITDSIAAMARGYAPKNNEQEAKSQMSLIPMDLLAKFLVPAYQEGLEKYYRESWREGFPISIMMDACLRHLTDFFYKGEDYDQDVPPGIKKHHLGAAMFCILSMLETLETRPDLDDRQIKKEGL